MIAAARIPCALRRLAQPRQRAALAVAGLVVLAHAYLLSSVARVPGPGWRAEPARSVRVRQIAQAPPASAQAQPGSVRSATPSMAPHRTPGPMKAQAGPAAPPATPPEAAAAGTQADAVPASPDPGGQSVPTYRTQFPPALTLQYETRRGLAQGLAQLDWRPLPESYELSLKGHAPAAPQLSWSSQGGFDAAGMAPLRYVESRRGRELRAVNFQRDSGRITFSGPPIEYPLVAGVQDRLSWMVQLAAVLAANPALAATDSQISLWVVGTRGDAEVWTFVVQGRQTLELPIGPVEDSLLLKREPRRPYDTQVQVWMDPARHYLPAQALLWVRATGEGTELKLQQLMPP